MNKYSVLKVLRSSSRWLTILAIWIWIGIPRSVPANALQEKGSAAMAGDPSESSPEKKINDDSSVPRISLGNITGSPGASLMIPLYYTPASGEPLRSVAVDIDYVGNHLRFQKAVRGLIPDDIAAEITGAATDGTPDAKGTFRSKLRVAVALTATNAPKGIPEGLVAYLMFQVTMDAKPFTIKLTPALANAEDLRTPARKLGKIVAVPGTVAVEIPDVLPAATCFFFSH